MIILVGTDKGLIEYSISNNWDITFSKIHFAGFKVGAIDVHKPSNTWRVALNHKHWGTKMHHSLDSGETWEEISCPQFDPGVTKPNGEQATLRSVWTIFSSEHTGESSFMVGTEPAGLFRTDDGGNSYILNSELWSHPTRKNWMGGGKESIQPFLHTILEDPEDQHHLYIGISAGGVFESHDHGKSWNAINRGVKADYLPDFNVEAGHDPHTVRICKGNPRVMWQQNHCGIYRSDDKGLHWENVSGTSGLPYYGFALVIDDQDDKKAWVIPAESDDLRYPHNHQLNVFHTSDGGVNWKKQSKGLPEGPSFDLVFRQGMEKLGPAIAFGTNNGNLYLSTNEGTNWKTISQNLASVRCVKLI